jgi:hypothetical protein
MHFELLKLTLEIYPAAKLDLTAGVAGLNARCLCRVDGLKPLKRRHVGRLVALS